MSAPDVVAKVAEAGLSLDVSAGKLVCTGPKAALTDELRSELATYRQDIIGLLTGTLTPKVRHASAPEVTAGPPRATTETTTAGPEAAAGPPSLTIDLAPEAASRALVGPEDAPAVVAVPQVARPAKRPAKGERCACGKPSARWGMTVGLWLCGGCGAWWTPARPAAWGDTVPPRGPAPDGGCWWCGHRMFKRQLDGGLACVACTYVPTDTYPCVRCGIDLGPGVLLCAGCYAARRPTPSTPPEGSV